MTPSVTSTSSSATTSAATSSNSSAAASASMASTDQNTFLQLLVAELENQDPTNPTDGTEFVTQLAEFQQLQTTMSMATDVSGIHTDTDQLVAIADGTGNSNAGTNNAAATGTTATSSNSTSSTQS
jgi:flagellar basal-body rod modification protein FlgD